jgi:hypothetical protein
VLGGAVVGGAEVATGEGGWPVVDEGPVVGAAAGAAVAGGEVVVGSPAELRRPDSWPVWTVVGGDVVEATVVEGAMVVVDAGVTGTLVPNS